MRRVNWSIPVQSLSWMLLRCFPANAVPDKQRKVLDFIHLKKKKTWTRVFLEHRWSGESRLDVVCSVEDAGIQSSTTCQVSDCSRGGRGVTAYTAVSWSVWFPLRWKNKLKQYSDQLWRQIKHTVFKRNISFTGLEIYCLHPGSIVFVKCKGMKKTFAVITVLKFLK